VFESGDVSIFSCSQALLNRLDTIIASIYKHHNGNDLFIKSPKVCKINVFSYYTIIGMIRNISCKSLEDELVQIVGIRLVTR